jgi:hypothetical protein
MRLFTLPKRIARVSGSQIAGKLLPPNSRSSTAPSNAPWNLALRTYLTTTADFAYSRRKLTFPEDRVTCLERRNSMHRRLAWLLLFVFSPLPSLAVDCTTISGNLVSPCSFDSAPEVAAWPLEVGDSSTFAAGAGETNGAALIDAADVVGVVFTFTIRSGQCFQAVPGQQFDVGYVVRLASGTAANCSLTTDQYTDGACGVFQSGIGPTDVAANGSYQEVLFDYTAEPGVNSFEFSIDCNTAAANGDFSVHVDNAFVVSQFVPAIPTLSWWGLALLAAALCTVAIKRLF